MKNYLNIDVLQAAKERTSFIFDNFKSIYLSFSGGKDSTVMLHIAIEEAVKRGRRIGILIVDLEGQYEMTINHLLDCCNEYEENIDLFWVCLPISLRNAVSVYEPTWVCWDKDKKNEWIRQMPDCAISDESFFPFFSKGMEFEEFVPLFGEWYSKGEETACLVGIRCDESLNRYRSIVNKKKVTFKDKAYTTKVTENVFNCYPIYDWKTEDIWVYTKKFNKPMNQVYERMRMANVPLSSMRICQPYGDDQRRGLWLFHLLEPQVWNKVVQRVSGVNSGSLYIEETGNINGYGKINKPNGLTYKGYAELLLSSLPDKIRNHYAKRFSTYIKWWEARDYAEGIPDEAPYELEAAKVVPSYRRICKCILRNDYWCKGLSFTQPKSEAYKKFINMKKGEKNE